MDPRFTDEVARMDRRSMYSRACAREGCLLWGCPAGNRGPAAQSRPRGYPPLGRDERPPQAAGEMLTRCSQPLKPPAH
jgi:hypothetical protein